MPEIGKAYVQIVPSAEGISGELENLLSGEAGSAGSAAGELFSANFGGALGGITEISSQVISSVVGAIGSITSELSSGISDVAAYGDNIDNTIRTNDGLCLTADIPNETLEIWAGELSEGNYAVILLNRGHSEMQITATWEQIRVL